MKIPPRRLNAFLSRPDSSVIAVLVYGYDSGLIRERIDTLTGSILSDPTDPFRLVDLPAAVVQSDPACLYDEAAALSMTGGRRVVRVQGAGDGVTRAVENVLRTQKGDSLILLEGGELGPRSSLRKLCETAANAAALPCYADDGANLAAVIRETLAGYGLTGDSDALHYLTLHLGADRRITRSEIDKLALYMGKAGNVSLEDAAACIGDGTALSMDDLVLATAEGNHADAQRMLARLLSEGTAPVTVLRALLRHFQRLHLISGVMAGGATLDQALAGLKPPLHFRVAGRVRAQATRWTTERLGDVLDLIVGAEINCKKTGMPADEICARLLVKIASAAKAGRR